MIYQKRKQDCTASTTDRSKVALLAIIAAVAIALTVPSQAAPDVDQQADEPDYFNMSIEDLMRVNVGTVYSASKYGQKVSEAPSSVTVITADDIQKHGYRTFADIMRSIPGFYTTYDRNYTYLGVRGFGRPGDYNSRILILIDGYRTNENVYGATYIGGAFLLDVDLIERVEIVRGPGSSLYGSSAFFAVINIITKAGRDIDGIELAAAAADNQTYKQRYTYGKQFAGGADLLLSFSDYHSRGDKLYFDEFDAAATNYGIARHADNEKHYNVFSKLIYGDFTVQGAFVWRQKRIPTAPWGTVFNDNRTRTRDKTGFLSVKYEHDFDGKLGVMARAYYGAYHYDGRYIYPEPYVNYDYAQGHWMGTELRFTKRLGKRHKLIWGGEWQTDLQQDQGNYDIYGIYLDDERESEHWGIFLQDEYQATDKLTVVAGARRDVYWGKAATNPRLAVIYKLARKSTLKLLYGEAFRAANVYEKYYGDGGWSQKGNPGLSPETIKTYEAVLEHDIHDNLRGTASVFMYEIEDLITATTDPDDGLSVFQNIDEVKARGFELGIDGKAKNGVRTRASYSFVKTENQQTHKKLGNSPQDMAKLNIIAPIIKDKLFAAVELQHVGERETLTSHHADAFLLANLTIFGKNIAKNLDASFTVYNLFDKTYGDPGFSEHTQDVITQNGRSFWAELTYRFK
ncbi:MAG: TonB-dependent receptor [Sedimentisphaerales bacterium]|nr:TonB-dependent receptor [Sedimentisphaerales bacterium]